MNEWVIFFSREVPLNKGEDFKKLLFKEAPNY